VAFISRERLHIHSPREEGGTERQKGAGERRKVRKRESPERGGNLIQKPINFSGSGATNCIVSEGDRFGG